MFHSNKNKYESIEIDIYWAPSPGRIQYSEYFSQWVYIFGINWYFRDKNK